MIKKKMETIATATLALSMCGWMHYAIAAEDMPGMDHGSMDHGSMDHGSAGHSHMNHVHNPEDSDSGQAKHSSGERISGDARDPHAHSGGYDFGMMPRHHTGDGEYRGAIKIDRLENVQTRNNAYAEFDLQAWLGKDYNRLVLKGEGEMDEGKLHEASTELLWGHALAPYWDSQLGVRHDSGEAPDRQWLALGVQGLAPYWFEVGATAYLGKRGHSALNLEAEYELLLTQKLVLQPRLEANFYGKQDITSELGSGLSDLTTGLRLRYEIHREFAPYAGVEWSNQFGGTADFSRAAGGRTNETRVIVGVRFWY